MHGERKDGGDKAKDRTGQQSDTLLSLSPEKNATYNPGFTSQVQISFISRTDEDRSIWQLQAYESAPSSSHRRDATGTIRRSVYLDVVVVARESCGRRNGFVPLFFFLFLS